MTGLPFGKIARATCAVWSGTTYVRFASSDITHPRLTWGRIIAEMRHARSVLYFPPMSKCGRAGTCPSHNDRVRGTVAGVFHHISPQHAGRYLTEAGFRRSQRVVSGQAVRRTRNRREAIKPLWSRIPCALQLPAVFKSAVGRQLRRTAQGGIQIRCAVAVFG